MQEPQVQSLDWEHPLEKEMAIHFSILAWEIPGCKKIRHDLGLNNNIHTYIHTYIHTDVCVMLQGMWDLSSPPEIKLLPPALKVCRYNHWTARKVQIFIYIYIFYILIVVLFIYIYICMFIFFDTSVL